MKAAARPLLFLVVALAAPGLASAEEWRFCVGVAPAAHETVITDIFSSPAESAQIEHRLEAHFRSRKGKSLTFQCPRGAPERFAALNAQTAALQFNRQMGFSVNGFSAADVGALVADGDF
jgi:hypothetical protein